MFGIGYKELLIGIFILILYIVPLWRVYEKAGYRGAVSLLILIPIAGYIFVFFYLAFAKWPILIDLEQKRLSNVAKPSG